MLHMKRMALYIIIGMVLINMAIAQIEKVEEREVIVKQKIGELKGNQITQYFYEKHPLCNETNCYEFKEGSNLYVDRGILYYEDITGLKCNVSITGKYNFLTANFKIPRNYLNIIIKKEGGEYVFEHEIQSFAINKEYFKEFEYGIECNKKNHDLIFDFSDLKTVCVPTGKKIFEEETNFKTYYNETECLQLDVTKNNVVVSHKNWSLFKENILLDPTITIKEINVSGKTDNTTLYGANKHLQLYLSDTDIMMYVDFDENTSTYYDYTNNNHDSNSVQGMSWDSNVAFNSGGISSDDGTDDWVDFTYSNDINTSDKDFSVFVWIDPDVANDYDRLIHSNGNLMFVLGEGFNSQEMRVFWRLNSSVPIRATGGSAADISTDLHHWGFTYDISADNYIIYDNSAVYNSGASESSTWGFLYADETCPDKDLRFNARCDGGGDSQADYDEFLFFDRLVNASDVAKIYNGSYDLFFDTGTFISSFINGSNSSSKDFKNISCNGVFPTGTGVNVSVCTGNDNNCSSWTNFGSCANTIVDISSTTDNISLNYKLTLWGSKNNTPSIYNVSIEYVGSIPPITCFNVGTSGYHTLNYSITDAASKDCINITASDVVFDCNGSFVDGVDTVQSHGILVTGNNVTVYGCNVTDWYGGITYVSVEDGNISDSIGSSNYYSFEFSGVNDSLIDNVTAVDGTYGGVLADIASNCTFSNVLSYGHNGTGGSYGYGMSFELEWNDDNVVLNSTFHSNRWGIYLYDTRNSNITNNEFRNNSQGSVRDRRCRNCTIYNNLFNDSTYLVHTSTIYDNDWNITEVAGTRIISDGTNIGGNYWTNSTGDGFSDTCTDSDTDGFCDSPFNITEMNTCTAGSDCSPNTDYLAYSDEYVEDNCACVELGNNKIYNLALSCNITTPCTMDSIGFKNNGYFSINTTLNVSEFNASDLDSSDTIFIRNQGVLIIR